MPVVSRYCNICNRLITAREIESGEAIVYQTYYYCPKCKEEAMPIIDAIRRRQERAQEKKEQVDKKKSSTRFGAAPGAKKAKPSSSTHKLHKTRSGIFHGHKPAPQPPRKPRAGQRPKAGTGPAHRPPKHASAEPAGKPASPFKPAAEFEEAVKKASGPRPPVKPAPPAADVPDPREKVGSDSERIEVIGELVADEAFGVEGMTFEDVIAAAEPEEIDPETDKRLAASGITFEDMAQEPPGGQPGGSPGPAAAVEAGPKPVEAEILPEEPMEAPVPETEQANQEPLEVQMEESETEELRMPAPLDRKAGDRPAPESKPSKHVPHRTTSAISRFQKHVHPGKRHTALHVPAKKKPWLLIAIIIMMALGGGGLIVYNQFIMKPAQTPSEQKKEEDEKKRYAELEKSVSGLADRARKIAESPGDFASFAKEMAELDFMAMPGEFRERLTKAKKVAEEGFKTAANLAFTEVKTGYEKAFAEKDLEAALSALEAFPALFKDTDYSKEQVPGLKAPVEKTLAILQQFRGKKLKAAQLESEGSFEEAAGLLETITFNPDEVLPEYLTEIKVETKRLKDLAQKEKERLEQINRARREAFQAARKEAQRLADEGKFQEAIDRLVEFRKKYPDLDYEGNAAMKLIENLVEKKRRAEIRNFFNGKDLDSWTKTVGWKVAGSEITGVSADSKMWLLKGEAAWTDYRFEFDFYRRKGSLTVCLRAVQGEPESGFTLEFGERPFQSDTWYHVKCEVTGSSVYITTSFNNERRYFPVKRASGVAGFLLLPSSDVRVKNVTMDLP